MGWRNIWRNPRRTILTVSAIAFAGLLLVFMLSFQFGTYSTMINASVKIHTGHLQVQAGGYNEKMSMRMTVSNPRVIGRVLEKINGVEAYSYRANAFSLVSSSKRTEGVLVIGIDPEKEAGISTIKKLIREGSSLVPGDSAHAIVGRLLAKNLKVGPGDELTLLGQGRDGSIAATVVTVKGIYSSGIDEIDRSSIQIPLVHFQEIYSMDGNVHEIVITGNALKNVSKIKEELKGFLGKNPGNRQLVALDWMELMPGLLQGIQLDLASGTVFYIILILVVAFSILNTFLMAIFERTREFGVMMAIGTAPGRLTKILMIESISITLVGLIAGITLGSALTLYFQVNGIDISGASELLNQFGISGKIYPKLSIVSALTGPTAVLLITIPAALYPALKVRRLSPVEAMAHI